MKAHSKNVIGCIPFLPWRLKVEIKRIYHKVASSSLSQLEPHFQIFRRLMKGKFDAYVLWPLAKKVQNWIVDRSTARNSTVIWWNWIKFYWFKRQKPTWFLDKISQKSATVSRQRNLFSNKERNHESWFSLWIFFRSVWIILKLNNVRKYFLNEFFTRYSWNIYTNVS